MQDKQCEGRSIIYLTQGRLRIVRSLKVEGAPIDYEIVTLDDSNLVIQYGNYTISYTAVP